jgi:squalene-hopene/tetraprenyl-beta-curcumene cyclase
MSSLDAYDPLSRVARSPADVLENHVETAIDSGLGALSSRQRPDGHWAFELEADATIPAEYILLNHFLNELDPPLEAKLAVYLRRIQGAHGGWPLFPGGDFDISATVKAYYALKLVGDSPDDPHMRRAREAVLAAGGAARANVFTRIALALFGQVPWRAVPVLRPEAMFMPRWFLFHVSKVSYWSRTVMVPLFVLGALKPKAANPKAINVAELFVTPPEQQKHYLGNPTGSLTGWLFLKADQFVRFLEPAFPRAIERRAIERAMGFVRTRLNGIDGLGGIFPAMANAVMAFHVLGVPKDDPDRRVARAAIDKLVVHQGDEAYVQPCLSPVWDTGLSLLALLEAGDGRQGRAAALAAGDWLRDCQILDVQGDWTAWRPGLRPGGWAFQYRNDYYPDVDDTAMVAMALHRLDPERYGDAVDRAAEWVLGMQSANGGWGAFDADNEFRILEHIPFADHGALLDPPTADVSARCLGMLIQLGFGRDHPAVSRAISYLKNEQEPDGSWFGRWGTNFIYGTWSAVAALTAAGEDLQGPCIRRAVDWLVEKQRPDGGWGEDCASYWPERRGEALDTSLPSQTAWAILALIAAGEINSPAVAKGVTNLINTQGETGSWHDPLFNAVGFPRVFYLRYHGYATYFPLWALARFRNLKAGNNTRPAFGI